MTRHGHGHVVADLLVEIVLLVREEVDLRSGGCRLLGLWEGSLSGRGGFLLFFLGRRDVVLGVLSLSAPAPGPSCSSTTTSRITWPPPRTCLRRSSCCFLVSPMLAPDSPRSSTVPWLKLSTQSFTYRWFLTDWWNCSCGSLLACSSTRSSFVAPGPGSRIRATN